MHGSMDRTIKISSIARMSASRKWRYRLKYLSSPGLGAYWGEGGGGEWTYPDRKTDCQQMRSENADLL